LKSKEIVKNMKPFSQLIIKDSDYTHGFLKPLEPEYLDECKVLKFNQKEAQNSKKLFDLIYRLNNIEVVCWGVRHSEVRGISIILHKFWKLGIKNVEITFENQKYLHYNCASKMSFDYLRLDMMISDPNSCMKNIDVKRYMSDRCEYFPTHAETLTLNNNTLVSGSFPNLTTLFLHKCNIQHVEVTTLKTLSLKFCKIDSLVNLIKQNPNLENLTLENMPHDEKVVNVIQESNITKLMVDFPIISSKLKRISWMKCDQELEYFTNCLSNMPLLELVIIIHTIKNGDNINMFLNEINNLANLKNVCLFFHESRNYTGWFDITKEANELLSKPLERIGIRVSRNGIDIPIKLLPETVIKSKVSRICVDKCPQEYECKTLKLYSLKDLKILPCLKRLEIRDRHLAVDTKTLFEQINNSNLTSIDIVSPNIDIKLAKKILLKNYKLTSCRIGGNWCRTYRNEKIVQRNRKLVWNYAYKKILEFVFKVLPLGLSTYLVLELVDRQNNWKHINQYKKVRLIASVVEGKKVEYY